MEQLQIIEAKVIWMPINDILFVVNQINEYLGLQLIDVKELTQNLEYYEENYTVFNCKIILAEPFSEYVQEIIHKWCNKEIIGDNRKWLSLNDIEKLHLDFILADKQIEAESFSFGTVVELNDFVEFYGSQKQNSDENLEYAINEIEVSFEHDCEKFSLFFVVSRKETYIKEPNDEIALPHHFEFDYSNISRMLLNKVSDSDNLEIYLYLKYPPLIYGIEERQKPEYFDDESSSEDLDPVPFRKTKFADCLESDITLSTVLKLEIPWYSAWEAVCNFVHNCKEVECFISPICTSFKNEIYPVPKIEVNFNCNYALQCILSRNNDIIMQLHMRNELISVEQKLNELASQDPNALEKALYKIYFALERKNIVIFSNALNSLFSKYNGIPNLNSDYSNLVSLRQAVLTPTRIIFLSPLTYLNNGLFKKFDADYAIHLSVRDENFQYLTDSLTEESSQNKIIPTIEKKLKEGFKIGNRQYNILGYNSKMLKDHSIMFCAEDSNGNGMETILKSISKSKQLKDTIGHMKFMEEMLTESLTSLEVNGINISEIHDKCIPSGSGRISPEVIKMVCDKLELDYIPSAMKVLYGGCELTLSMWPCLEGKQIIFNKSENNISSCNSHIEILKISKPKLVHLNRFLVMILSQLNVKDVTFFNLQEKMLKTMLRCFIDEKKAKHLFKAHNLFCINYDDLQEDFELLQEPFFQSLLQTIILKQLENLRKDTQISIPSSKGRTMLGIVDETKLLNPGEVFLQCSKDIWNNNTETDIITGSVLIVRSPCIHLSDVQKFTAVDIEELHHIKDCIVFSQKVQQNSMKVSYGDEYLVIWMDELQFPCLNPLVKEEEEILQSCQKGRICIRYYKNIMVMQTIRNDGILWR
ncbi:uncharacterized protein LOC111619721 isoform X1 [Centruroides sculpturatus]|uniref:uncharacterized protein LOC111619721 isoform X1 n=2 Tax=Centruroides sculpturatus TaxID=218467 RepID=UPI000C6D7883|nr:uncharacterized protein LOC111619721 isoform X1 [Centruroides sculpturatus]XP_023217270.1 uncharacterized protein LOC111619721 isoform X1 [Centruroides sculpturatus]XP_023217271.1 uncharacterized protein LOC111619721 isoform X1 [Centruroides sculpturatus]XP_023217272.1 uncharacterized protein LOC111619721 isoform X1 [Centruroides sculpturatus]